MKTILIANPKGGSGKTTLATNLAGYFATRGRRVVLADLDRQQSAVQWLQRRPYKLPLIHQHQPDRKSSVFDPEWLIADSPAGLREEKLSNAVKRADCVIVPVQPSAFDIGATRTFLEVLAEEKAVRKQKTFVAMVGMRVDSRTRSAALLNDFMKQAGFPVLTCLRDSQVYALAAEQGASLFDIRPSQVARDLQQWAPLLHWIMKVNDLAE
ncbi:chromosome partitioning protein [Novimethylophilus kurashikiensis]|uniref:Chromosome partitioning protein n=1 Tax=Novimethylophilus kurashikiensis TaxID=1825523 RepID=A0A2R5F774_9PROT|nr:ParA family protein [Novimethylophilus kurashikiensis]GBG14080.1 chromosome partitioning protein [Novimethylophilus kurashikiensis]